MEKEIAQVCECHISFVRRCINVVVDEVRAVCGKHEEYRSGVIGVDFVTLVASQTTRC